MPAPERVTPDEIVAAAVDILEAGGPDAMTMQAVATRVGVRAPSLYKRVGDRADLLALAARSIVADAGARLADAEGADAEQSVRDLAHAFRRFARERPEGFRYAFGTSPSRPVDVGLREAVAPLLRVTGALVGPDHALHAARTFTAWATGFILMELADAFRLGGDVDEAFEWGLDRLVAGLRA